MAKNHYTSKTKRRPKSGKRKDQGAETMKRLKEHEQAEVQAVVERAVAPVRLKNGSEEAGAMVGVVMMSLRKLVETNPIAFYELAMLSRNPHHELFGNTGKALSKLALLSADGHVHNSIRNVVISAVEGDGMDMVLRSPVALEPKIEAELAALAQKKDEDIDTSDIPEVTDWSKAEVGKFYREPRTVGECLQDSLGGIPSDILADVHEDKK